ncbi:SCO family protein [Polynucleobacter sp. AP-Elch-400A-B2]|uniref:SCO family protein n=1 Tax=Polynucleobacter sp. AP-Elch-400A-B2 TaxID=2576930 RepID=UPI001BFEE331|nr:SCO family protein [Polynucleobacter sp. AP-Elch-400A-B2]QWE24550.1 SCO family protein [Polynucleobacter sp. AP-Elch-400A-B2]
MNMNSKKSYLYIARLLILSLTAAVLLACSPQQNFKNVDITGSKAFGTDFSLLDPDGKVRTLADFKGKVVLMFFGYTQCPDVCPTTLTEMQQVMTLLGPQADKVQVLFVTVDPERDTAAILKQYVPAFDSRFLGLRPADEAALERVTKDFKVYYQKVPGMSSGSYTMDHMAGSYAFDPEGHLRLYIKHAQGAETLAQDLKELLK